MEAGNKKRYLACFVVIWAVQMAAAFYFCTQKEGFYEDEYYTYYSTARTNGFYVEDGVWLERDTYRNEFVVLPGQQFQYGLVKLVQSWDVHPPVYYWVFHTAASLAPGVFSKWIGLGVNLFFHGINLILLTYLSYLASGRKVKRALFVTLFYGLTPAAISGVVFIRMYELLTVFVLACAILHVRAVTACKSRKLPFAGFLAPMMAVTYLGFLTQYYYFIFLFYIAAAFCVWLLWRDRSIVNCLWYGGTQIIALGLAWLTYPSCLGQMFRGQRGAQATGNFLDMSNTLTRLRFFYELLDEYVFGKMLAVFLLVIVVVLLPVGLRRRKEKLQLQPQGGANIRSADSMAYGILLFAVTGYFLTVAKTALLLGGTSNRYQLPVYGIIVLLIFQAIGVLYEQCVVKRSRIAKRSRWLPAVCALVCLLIDLQGLAAGRVVFLYPEDREQTAFAEKQAQAGTPVVYLYNEDADWCVWDVANELMEYDRVYFAAADKESPITDDVIQNASSLVVYLADGADVQTQLARIYAGSSRLSACELQYEEKYCDVYYFWDGEGKIDIKVLNAEIEQIVAREQVLRDEIAEIIAEIEG